MAEKLKIYGFHIVKVARDSDGNSASFTSGPEHTLGVFVCSATNLKSSAVSRRKR
jgi:hypothetical protein